MGEVKARRRISGRSIAFLIVAVLLVVLPAFLSEFRVRLLNEMLVLGLFAIGYNLLMGYTGLVSFGPAAFFGAGAYTTIILLRTVHVPLPLAILAGPAVGALLGFIVGQIAFRRTTGVQFALITLGFGQLVWAIVWKWHTVTGGENGILWFGFTGWMASIKGYYYFSLVIIGVAMGALYIITRSAFGCTLRGIRENEERLKFMGIDTTQYKIIAHTIMATFGGLAGTMGALLARGAFPEFAFWSKTAQVVLASILGGMYSFFGPVVGASIMIFLQYIINRYTERWLIVLGTIVILLVLFLPGGVMGFMQREMLRGRAPLALPRFGRRRRATVRGS